MNKTWYALASAVRSQSVVGSNKHLTATIDLHAQTKRAHWNVQIQNFTTIHELFDSVSEEFERLSNNLAELTKPSFEYNAARSNRQGFCYDAAMVSVCNKTACISI